MIVGANGPQRYPANAGFPPGDKNPVLWFVGTRPRPARCAPLVHADGRGSHDFASLCLNRVGRCHCYACAQTFPSRAVHEARRGFNQVEEARDRRPATRPGARTASAGQGRNGCAISRKARSAALAAVRAQASSHRRSRLRCMRGSIVAFLPAPARPLAPTERSNHGSRDRRRGAQGAGGRRAHRSVQARCAPAEARNRGAHAPGESRQVCANDDTHEARTHEA